MSLLESQDAIGAVSELLRARMMMRLNNLNVTIGRPETAAAVGDGRKINLFLYRVGFDGHLRNEPLDPGQEPPLWMVLHYLMTAFDEHKESDSADAHRLLGNGLVALQEMNFLRPSVPALARNPAPLKITFDEADVDLLSKLMQGSEEKYRVSAAFQVRPVMIVPDLPGSYAPLVKTVGPPVVPAKVLPVGQGVEVLPSLGPQLQSLAPERFAIPAKLTLRGRDLAGVNQVQLGPESLAATASPAGEIALDLPMTALSAGAYPITASRLLASGHTMASNALLAHLLPRLDSATPGALTAVSVADPRLHGDLALAGERLGAPGDSIFVAFYADGALQLMVEPEIVTSQIALKATVTPEKPLASGNYLVILRVNGEQADDAPTVSWT
jgi:hypothetical protein